jgi:hypothetical protein
MLRGSLARVALLGAPATALACAPSGPAPGTTHVGQPPSNSAGSQSTDVDGGSPTPPSNVAGSDDAAVMPSPTGLPASSSSSGGVPSSPDASAAPTEPVSTSAEGGAPDASMAPAGGIGGAAAAVYDDFENDAVGVLGPPWQLTDQNGVPNAMYTPVTTVTVDTTRAHSGTHSVKISSGGGFFGVPPPTSAFYGRAWVYLDGTPGSGHWAFIEGVSSGAQGAATQVRWGGNVGTYDANVQTSGPEYEIQARADGGAIAPPASQWMCVEFYYGQGALQLWQDGTQILNITSTTVWQGGAAPSLPAYAMVRLGYAAFGASSIDVWFDDVAIDPRRIGCN